MATPKKPSQWDVKVFEKMAPPIRLRIERKNPRTGQMEPIPLPQDVWSKEDAERIEQIILNDVAGGGSYKGQMIDSNGTSMEWTFAFPTDYFPPLIPPGSAAALGQSQAAQPTPPAVAGTPAAIPAWQRGAYGTPVSPPGQAFVPPYSGAPMTQQQPPFGYAPNWWPPQPTYTAPPASTSRKDDTQTEHLRQQLDALRQANADERHAREREAADARHREQVAAMQSKFADEMRQMREMMAESKRTRPEDDPAILAMKQQNELLQKQMEDQRRQLEQQQAEARHRDEMRMLQENNQRQIDALKDLISKATENRTDPQMTMLIEMQRQQSEAQREQSRIQAEIQREATRNAAESPRQMVDMMERLRSAGGLEQTLSAINASYTGLMDQQRGVLEMVMNMGPDPKMALAEGALAGVKEVAERFVVSKRDETIARERTEQLKAQERAYTAQAYAAQAAAQDPYRYEDGSIKGEPPQREQLAGQQEEVEEHEEPVVTKKNGKPSEQEFFGPLMEHVTMLRDAAAKGEVDPDTLATFVIQAAMAVEQSGEVVPVYVLYHEERYAELVDVLLPGIPSEFAGECVTALAAKIAELGIGQQGALIDDEPDDNRAQA